MKYSKFKSLTYEEHDDFEEFWKKNKFIKDIFEDSWLFSQNYKHFNDIDECVYLVNSFIKKTLTDKIYDKKQEYVICCFSNYKINNTEDKINKTEGKELMWAHYANSSKGIRIDFTIDEKFKKYVKQVQYDLKHCFNSNRELEEVLKNGLENIMRRKSKVWEYEQEYRAIFSKYGEMNRYTKNKTDFFFPINIEAITFGRGCGFFPNTKPYNDAEAYDFKQEQENAEKHILKIASFIYKVLKESNKYDSPRKIPKFYCYKDKYSSKPDRIKQYEIKKQLRLLKEIDKTKDKIQNLEQKIVDLKKEINGESE